MSPILQLLGVSVYVAAWWLAVRIVFGRRFEGVEVIPVTVLPVVIDAVWAGRGLWRHLHGRPWRAD
jgi:hypothetical protein